MKHKYICQDCEKIKYLKKVSPFDFALVCECGGQLILIWGAEPE